ncbi:glycoside hydrolase [Planctomycetaceae bacterium SH139]
MSAEMVPAQQQLIIDYAVEHQQIDNFGASDAWSINPTITRWSNQGNEAAIERLADYLFSTERGIGLSAWRFNIGAGSAEQGTASRIPDPLRRAELLMPTAGAAIDPTKQWGQIRFLQAAHQRGVADLVAFVNSPPAWATKNGLTHPGDGSGVGSSNLKPESRNDFAEFLVAVIEYLRGPRVGVPVNYISPLNEPTWDWQGQTQEGSPYNNQDIKTVYRQLQAALRRAKLADHVHVDGTEAVEYTAALGDPYMDRFNETIYKGGMNDRALGLYRNYIDQFLSDPEMQEILHNKISLHGYFSDAWKDRLGALRDLTWENIQAASPGAKVWMSEFCILGDAGNARSFTGNGFDVDDMDLALHVATVIHRDLVRLNASAWHWWLALTPYDYKDGLIKINPTLDPDSIQPSKLFWAFGNFSRFIRPGYHRLHTADADDLEGLMASAYKSPDGKRLVVVMINASEAAIAVKPNIHNLPGTSKISGFASYTTDAVGSLAESFVQAECSLPPRSVVTLVADLRNGSSR